MKNVDWKQVHELRKKTKFELIEMLAEQGGAAEVSRPEEMSKEELVKEIAKSENLPKCYGEFNVDKPEPKCEKCIVVEDCSEEAVVNDMTEEDFEEDLEEGEDEEEGELDDEERE